MQRTHGNHSPATGPRTTGATIHTAARYDFHTRLMGLGVSGPNSRMIVEMARIKPGDKVLDVGCGSGNLTLTAQKYVGQSGSVYGIDAAPEMIKVAREKASHAGSAAVFEVGLIEQLPYPDAMFDVVISRLVIHHLPEDVKQRGFAEIFRVLQPGGLFFVADFKMPTHPFLALLASTFLGHGMMMQSDLESVTPMLKEMGFLNVASGSTRSAFLAFVSGKKPTL